MKFLDAGNNSTLHDFMKEIWLEYAESLDFNLSSIPNDLVTFPEPYRTTGGLYLVEIDGKIAGGAALKRTPPNALELKRFYIRPPYRRKGVGRAFMQFLIQQARKLNATHLHLETVLPSMQDAHRLYQSIGFYEVSTYFNEEVNSHVSVMEYNLFT